MIPVPGTRISLSPPEGFLPAQSFCGFEHPEQQATIAVSEIPLPLAALAAQWTAPAVVAEPIEIDGVSALWVTAIEQAPGGPIARWLLAFGVGDRTIAVVAAAPTDSDIVTQQALARSVRTAQLSEHAAPGSVLPFVFAESQRMKVAARMGSVVLLTEGGGVGRDECAPMLTLGASQGPPFIADTDLAALAEEYLQAIPGVTDFTPYRDLPAGISTNAGSVWIVGEARVTGTMRPIVLFQRLSFVSTPTNGLLLVAVGRCDAEERSRWLDELVAIAEGQRCNPDCPDVG